MEGPCIRTRGARHMAVKSKPQPPSSRLDVVAFVLFVAGLLIAACVLSHIPGDDGTQHPFGSPGAWLADAVIDALGFAVYVLLAGWAILALTLFLKPSLNRWLTRVVGWLLIVPSSAVAFDPFSDAVAGPAIAGSA